MNGLVFLVEPYCVVLCVSCLWCVCVCVCVCAHLQMPVMSKLVEHDPVIMVSSPRPLPPISDFGQLGLPASLRQVGVVWEWVCPVCVLGRGWAGTVH